MSGADRHRRTRGAYTAELAVALPSLLVLVACGLLVISSASASLRCHDATRSGARALARGEPMTAVVAAATTAAPRGAEIDVARDDGMAEVRCAAAVRVAGLRAMRVSSRSVAAVEDDATTAGGAP